MDKITRQVRIEHWTQIMNECLNSGMNKTEWCRANGISDKQFFYWQRILRKEAFAASTSKDLSVITDPADEKVIINKELSRVNAEAMQKLKEKDILKIFPTQKPHCTTRLVLKTPKTETSNRVVWLPKTVAELLVQYKKDQQELKEFLGSAYNDYNLVIALDNGNPVESRIVRDRFQKLCEENDYEVVVFHSLRHLSTGYKLKMTNGDVKSVQGDTGHAEAEMVTDVYSEIIDEDRRFNAQKMDKEFYSTLNDDTDNPKQDTDLTDSDMALLELIKSLSPEMKEQFLKQALQR